MTITTSIPPRIRLQAESADKRSSRAAAAVTGRRPAAELRASNPEGINQWTERKARLDEKFIPIASGKTKDGIGFTVHQRKDRETNFIATRDDTNEEIAQVAVRGREQDDGSMVVGNSVSSATMEDEHRHKGIGSVMYKAIENRLGKKLVPSDIQTPAAEAFWKKRMSAKRAVSQHPLEAAAGPLPGQIERVIVSLQNDGRLPIRIPPETMRHVAESLARYFQTASKDKIEQFAEAAKAAVEAELKTENIQTHDTMKADTSGVNVGATPATSRGVLTSFIESATGENIGGLMNMDFFNRIMREVTQGAGNFVAQNFDQTRLDEFPALELHRVYDREVPRGFKVGKGGAIVEDPDNDWPSRWEAAGGELVDGRMVALKSDPIWQAIGDGAGGYEDTLGNPFAPFAFNSGFDTDEVSREDAVALGLMDDEDEALPAKFDFRSLLDIEAASAAVSTRPGVQMLENGSRRARLGLQAAVGDVPLVAKCFITDADGRLLVLQADGYGRMDLPGGHLRAGETVEDGLRREVLEETGMTLTDVKELGTVLVPWNGQQPIVFFSAKADTDAPLALSDEHVDWFWLNKHEVALRNFSALNKVVNNFTDGKDLNTL